MEADHAFVWALGLIGTLIGIGSLVWKVAETHNRNTQDHERIIELLEEMRNVETRLDDVLAHPDDTQFSVQPLKMELVRIREKLERLESALNTWLQRQ